MSKINRRNFMQDVTAASAAADAEDAPAAFVSDWNRVGDRVWIGPAYWANPLQDWRVAGGRLECAVAAPNRDVQLLTRQLGARQGGFQTRVVVGRKTGGPLSKSQGSAGFRVGVQGPLKEYRNSLIFGRGLDAGFTAQGGLFIGPDHDGAGDTKILEREALELRLAAAPVGDAYRLTLAAHDPQSGELLGEVTRDRVPADALVGNVALAVNYPWQAGGRRKAKKKAPGKPDQFWFDDWRLSGEKLETHDERAFGPILFSQYTLSDGVLKLSAQMPPLGEGDSQTVRLQFQRDGRWQTAAEAPIHPEACTAAFRVDDWDAGRDVPYRLVYQLQFADGASEQHEWSGTVRRDPVDLPELKVADICCNIHAAFPNAQYVAHMAKLEPDFLAFTGDQFYESSGGYGVQRAPLDMAILDYLRKWYLHGWTWRELMRDRPSISLPDDHDVYQGNVWGEAGAPRNGPLESGGYTMHPTWVNVVHRTQTAHHPDPYDPTPIKQGISVYYGPLTYGRVSFAVLADRMFKSGPEGKVPPTQGRGDHVTDPNFDPKTADVPGLELLGERQMQFLRAWAPDYRGAEMKAVISQTTFTAMATTHGRNRERLRADYDAGGWPQTPRNNALREIRKALAVHIAGDQHLPAVVHYGIDAQRDAGVAFAGPAINVGYPRWFEPEKPGENRRPGAPENTGEFLDHFGNPMTVLAVANGAEKPRGGVLQQMQERASGLGLVRFNKPKREITIECWPYLADPTESGTQYPGWPITINAFDNYARRPAAHLPELKIFGLAQPVVQVVNDHTGEIEYTLRLAGGTFRPPVFDANVTHTIHVGEQSPKRMQTLARLKPGQSERIEVRF
jgi:hypothetical protein